jgi:glycosyltransferase involved in cell wall biosynthesis
VVSIILTTCCVTDYRLSLLKTSMESMFRFTNMRDKELVVCDNGDDGQTEYLKTLRINKHLIFGENKGIPYARNAGAKESKGDYLCFVDSDLIYSRNWIGIMLSLLVRHKDKKLIASGLFGESMRKYREWMIESQPDYQIWSRTGNGCLLMSRKTWNKIPNWSELTWKIGAQFCSDAVRLGYRFIVPIPPVAQVLDTAPSYKKGILRKSCKKGKFIWEMIS